MAEISRKRLGILFNFPTSEWTGGFYYLINVIKCLDLGLEDDKKPEITVFYNNFGEKYLNEITYPYIQKVPLNGKYGRMTEGLLSIVTNKNRVLGNIIDTYLLDSLYPVNDLIGKIKNSRDCNIVSWIPDFQQKFYPENFSKSTLFFREFRFQKILNGSKNLVLSSNDAFSHLKRFYTWKNKNLNIEVLPFVSIMENGYENLDINILKRKYDISEEPYFIVSNQYYPHKNHSVIFEAYELLKELQGQFHIIFTGRGNTLDNLDLSRFKNNKNLHFVGIIPRNEQLCLMKHASAVIQPSKFEGWSTVVEDIKTLKGQIILSDIPIHREQIGEDAFYFTTDDAFTLCQHMKAFITQKEQLKPTNYRLADAIKKFAQGFIKVNFGKN